MCAILDANVVGEVFGSNLTPAGKEFRKWIGKGSGRLICSSELLEELKRGSSRRGSSQKDSSQSFSEWASTAVRTGKMKNINEEKVKTRMEEIEKKPIHLSNDSHILALAQVSGARLLYSNDKKLHKDFKNPALIDPVGSIYSTLRSKNFTRARRKLLEKRELCPSAQ